jgi:hypothetical protein
MTSKQGAPSRSDVLLAKKTPLLKCIAALLSYSAECGSGTPLLRYMHVFRLRLSLSCRVV